MIPNNDEPKQIGDHYHVVLPDGKEAVYRYGYIDDDATEPCWYWTFTLSLPRRAQILALSHTQMEMVQHLTNLEIRTQHCEDCDKVMKVWPDGKWRFRINPIRCQLCAESLVAKGQSEFDAIYVV